MESFGSPMDQLNETVSQTGEETEAERIGLSDDVVQEGMGMMAREMLQNAPTTPRHRPGPPPVQRKDWPEAMAQQGSESPPSSKEADRLDRLEASIGGLATVVTNLMKKMTEDAGPKGPQVHMYQEEGPGGGTSQPAPMGPVPMQTTSNSDPTSPEITGPPESQVTQEDTSSQTMEEGTTTQSMSPNLPPSEPQETSDPEEANIQFEERVAKLVERRVDLVEAYLHKKTPWKVFNQMVRYVHGNLGFNSWPPDMQREWAERFENVLTNRKMLRKTIRAVLRMQSGPAVGEGGLAGLAVMMAGCVALYTLPE